MAHVLTCARGSPGFSRRFLGYVKLFASPLAALIDAKVKGENIAPVRESRGDARVINLMDAIRQSMKQVRQRQRGKREIHKPVSSATRRKKSG